MAGGASAHPFGPIGQSRAWERRGRSAGDLLIPTRIAAARGESAERRDDGGKGDCGVFSRVISLQRGHPAGSDVGDERGRA